MSERTAFVVLIAGVVLTVASVLGISFVVVTQGRLPSLPDADLASTPYTRVGWLVGYVLIAVGVGIVVRMVRRPRRLRATARTASGAGRSYTAGRVQIGTRATAVMPAVGDETFFLPPNGPAVPGFHPDGYGRPPQFPPASPGGVERGRVVVAAGVEGPPVATTLQLQLDESSSHPTVQLAAVPTAEEGPVGTASPTAGGGRGVAAWAVAGRHALPQIATAAEASGGGRDETTNRERTW